MGVLDDFGGIPKQYQAGATPPGASDAGTLNHLLSSLGRSATAAVASLTAATKGTPEQAQQIEDSHRV